MLPPGLTFYVETFVFANDGKREGEALAADLPNTPQAAGTISPLNTHRTGGPASQVLRPLPSNKCIPSQCCPTHHRGGSGERLGLAARPPALCQL